MTAFYNEDWSDPRAVFVNAVQELIDAYQAAAPERERTREEVRQWFENGTRPMVEAGLRMALDDVGLQVEGPINELTITQAINEGPLAGTGVEFSNLFDKVALRQSLERIAIRKVCEQFGVEADSLEAVKAAIVAQFADVVGEQLASESGDIFDAAVPAPRIAAIIKGAVKKDGWNEPVDFTPAGISNRERQARYRAQHRRHWEER